MTTEGIGKQKNLSREQLLEYFRKRFEGSQSAQTDVVKELYEKDDMSLVTENHGSMIVPKIRMRIVLASIDTTRQKPLIQEFLDCYNIEMISLNRQGRLELLGALRALGAEEEEKTARG